MTRPWYRGLLPLFCGVYLALASPAGAVVVPPEVLESGSVIVTAKTAEVREGPSPKFQVMTIVEKGEIFDKQGRTGGWYCIRISDDILGWVSGRAIRRYVAEGSPAGPVAPDDRAAADAAPSYPGVYYYGYPYAYWGQPYFSWEWYFYDRDTYRDRTWYYDTDHRGDRRRSWDRDRHRDDAWESGTVRPRVEEPSRDGDWQRRSGSQGDYQGGRRSDTNSRPATPRIRGPFRDR